MNYRSLMSKLLWATFRPLLRIKQPLINIELILPKNCIIFMTIQSIVIIGLIKFTSMQSIYSEKEHSCASGQKTHLLWIPCIFCVSFSEVERTIYLKIYIHKKKKPCLDTQNSNANKIIWFSMYMHLSTSI